MLKSISTICLLCAVTLALTISGCSGGGGSQGAATSTPVSDPALSGAATADSLAAGTVTLKDSSVPVQARKTTISSDGTYTFITTGLVAPYILKAEWTDAAGSNNKMYSMAAAQPGNYQTRAESTTDNRANINQFSDAAMNEASAGNPDDLFDNPDPGRYQTTASNLEAVISSLSTVLAPLFSLYNISGNPVSDANEAGLSAMFHNVKFVVASGMVTVTNRQTGGVIFTGPTNNIASGTFHPENMPGGTGSSGSAACTSFTYSAWGTCQSDSTQTRTVASSSPAGCTGGTPVLTQACTYVPPAPSPCTYNYSSWGTCQSDGTQTRTVLQSTPAGCTGTPVLSQTCTYVPPVTPCTSFTYSAWGACQSDSTQSRTVATSSPAGCTGGTPVLSQSCTYVPPVTSCTSFTYSAWGACDSTGNQTRTVTASAPAGCTGGTPVLSQTCTYVPPTCTYTYSAWGTCDSTGNQTRTVTASTPAGCTGMPALSQTCAYVPPTCTSFTYTAWGTCQSNGTQTRTVATSSPAGCTGGTPVLSQTCTYVQPTCTSFTYTAWGTCQSNGTQTRIVATSSPAGCTGGTPVLSQSCTPTSTVTLANVSSSCTGCHGLTVNTTVFASGGYSVSGRSASSWLSTVNSMVGLGASLAPGTTATDYANFLAGLP